MWTLTSSSYCSAECDSVTVWQCDRRRWQQFLCSNHCNSVCRLPGEVMDHQVPCLLGCSWFSENTNNPAKERTLLPPPVNAAHSCWLKICLYFPCGNIFVRIFPARGICCTAAAVTLTWHDWQFYFLCSETDTLNICLSQFSVSALSVVYFNFSSKWDRERFIKSKHYYSNWLLKHELFTWYLGHNQSVQ